MLITKSDYVLWRDCPHNTWVKKWNPDVYYASPLSEFEKHLIATGNMVEEKAHELFGEGVVIEGRDMEAVNKTKELLHTKTETIFQACFSDGTLFAAIDVLKQGKDGELYLYEIKASNASKLDESYGDTEDEDLNEGDTVVDFRDFKALEKYKNKLLKDSHLYDLAFQVYLARKVGYKVQEAFLVRLNRAYVRGTSLDIQKLFVREPVLKYIDEILDIIDTDIKEVIRFLSLPKKPDGPCKCIYKGGSKHCTTFREHNKEVPEYSVHNIANIGKSKKKLTELIDSGIYNIMNVPDDFLSTKMQKQVDIHKRGRADIDHEAIKEELAELKFPLYFLDYESFNPAIPRFTGYKPYQHIPFQYSLHVLTEDAAKKGIEPECMEPFFYSGKDDPSPLFVADLKKKIGKSGSIIVWNRTFEESHINKHLAIRLPEYTDFIQDINSRIFDLMKVFSKQLHIHPDFHGSASIKKVLPVLCPELSYKELDIGNGSEAMNTWNRLVTEDVPEAERKDIIKSMFEYCNLDTYAMYAIWKHLNEIT